jgi:amino acid permease
MKKVYFFYGIFVFLALKSGATFIAQRFYPTSTSDSIGRQLAYRAALMIALGVEIGVGLVVISILQSAGYRLAL